MSASGPSISGPLSAMDRALRLLIRLPRFRVRLHRLIVFFARAWARRVLTFVSDAKGRVGRPPQFPQLLLVTVLLV